jgi:hypothetical protein
MTNLKSTPRAADLSTKHKRLAKGNENLTLPAAQASLLYNYSRAM